MPFSLSQVFITTLSRHRSTTSYGVPGMPVRSRTAAAHNTWASMVASSLWTQGPRCWMRRTAW